MEKQKMISNKIQVFIKNLIDIEEIGVISALIVMGIFLGIFTENFLSAKNLLEISRQASYVGIMAIGMVFVMSTGGIDLSVGAIYMLSPIVSALALEAGINEYLAIFLGLATGAVCGFVNGGLSVLLKIPMIVITLGTTTIFRGLGLVVSSARPIFDFSKESLLFKIGGEFIGPFPTSAVIMFVLVIIFQIVYTLTPWGNRVRAVGANLEAAKFSGVRVNRINISVMVLQGVMCAVAGILAMLFLRVAEPTQGGGYEMYTISSAIIGGTSLSGGAGSVVGAFIGSVIISVIRNGLVLLGVHYYWTGVATGIVIISAVFLDYLVSSSRE